MDAIEALTTRRSVREFTADPVPREQVEAIVNCGRLAASAVNRQPWEFVAVTDAATRQAIADTTEHGKFIAQAPACIVVLCRQGRYTIEDGSAATQNMLVAARSLGLGSCWVAGHGKAYAQQVRDLVAAPDDCEVISLVAIGYPARETKPEKRTLAEVLHWERF